MSLSIMKPVSLTIWAINAVGRSDGDQQEHGQQNQQRDREPQEVGEQCGQHRSTGGPSLGQGRRARTTTQSLSSPACTRTKYCLGPTRAGHNDDKDLSGTLNSLFLETGIWPGCAFGFMERQMLFGRSLGPEFWSVVALHQ